MLPSPSRATDSTEKTDSHGTAAKVPFTSCDDGLPVKLTVTLPVGAEITDDICKKQNNLIRRPGEVGFGLQSAGSCVAQFSTGVIRRSLNAASPCTVAVSFDAQPLSVA